MNLKSLCFPLFLLPTSTFSQTHFTKFKQPVYKTADVQNGFASEDSVKLDIIDLKNILGLKGVEIHLRQVAEDSSTILIYRDKKLIQSFALPFMFWHLENDCMVADLDNNKMPDVKLTVQGGGSGLAGQLAYKIYLFNQGKKFYLLSFLDYSHENEYDLNRDGIYEIISCNHVLKGGHSYWVYNAFNFINGKIKNISGSLNYPLWTKHLNKSWNVIATNISRNDRYKEFKPLPDRVIIKQ